ncbi:response regulator transcription factor [Orrella sp. JC864]|uniref:response regulator transcription factor n=1 Tax=Orrella sp. JC864 TaxID=3120298 RepID=UPI003008E55A
MADLLADKRSILLIDDDAELAQMLCEYLAPDDYRVRVAHTGAQADALMAQAPFDIALLDLMLPDVNGLHLLKRLRARWSRPVIMFTAHGGEPDRVQGLELGADDYLAKPFSARELKARIHAVLRRFYAAPHEPAQEMVIAGPLSYDPVSGRTVIAGRSVVLTGAEQRILAVLMRAYGQVVSREAIGLQALGRQPGPFDRSVETHISSLRRKLGLEQGEAGLQVRNLRGQGYVLGAQAGAA